MQEAATAMSPSRSFGTENITCRDRTMDVAVFPDRISDAAFASSREPGLPALALLEALVSALDGEGVAYCYWKSSAHLPAVLAGESDLDLLVGRSDQHRAA